MAAVDLFSSTKYGRDYLGFEAARIGAAHACWPIGIQRGDDACASR
jgi:hypothetical protein